MMETRWELCDAVHAGNSRKHTIHRWETRSLAAVIHRCIDDFKFFAPFLYAPRRSLSLLFLLLNFKFPSFLLLMDLWSSIPLLLEKKNRWFKRAPKSRSGLVAGQFTESLSEKGGAFSISPCHPHRVKNHFPWRFSHRIVPCKKKYLESIFVKGSFI